MIEKYFYLWIVALVVPLWLIIFMVKRKSRAEMIYMGILFGGVALTMDYYCSFYDYWRPLLMFPRLNIESFFYGFFFGGISTKIYELIFRQEYTSGGVPRVGIMLLLGVLTIVLYVFFLFMGLHSVFIYVIVMGSYAVTVMIFKPKLIRISLLSGVLMTILNIGWYGLMLKIYPNAIRDIWLTKGLSGIQLFGVPIEEHYYIFTLGAYGAVIFKALPKSDRFSDETNPASIWGHVRPYWIPLFFLILAAGRILIWGPAGRIQIP